MLLTSWCVRQNIWLHVDKESLKNKTFTDIILLTDNTELSTHPPVNVTAEDTLQGQHWLELHTLTQWGLLLMISDWTFPWNFVSYQTLAYFQQFFLTGTLMEWVWFWKSLSLLSVLQDRGMFASSSLLSAPFHTQAKPACVMAGAARWHSSYSCCMLRSLTAQETDEADLRTDCSRQGGKHL